MLVVQVAEEPSLLRLIRVAPQVRKRRGVKVEYALRSPGGLLGVREHDELVVGLVKAEAVAADRSAVQLIGVPVPRRAELGKPCRRPRPSEC